MNPYGLSAFYGALALTTVWLSRAAPSSVRNIREAAILLLCTYLSTNITYYAIHESHWIFYTLIDGACAAVCLWIGVRESSSWLSCVGVIFALCVIRHAAFLTVGDFSHSAKYAYDFSLNLLFAGQLGIVATVAVFSARNSDAVP